MKVQIIETPDISEKGAGGKTSDRLLYMQLLAFGDCHDTAAVVLTLQQFGIRGAVYEDTNDPFGIAVVTFTESPEEFLGEIRRMFRGEPFIRMTPKHEYTMLGRSYSIGYEPNLDDVLIDRPIRTLLNPDWKWGIWYALRRKGKFSQLSPDKQKAILGEHGRIGQAFGQADLAHDIRLACHGLSKDDNDFIIGLIGDKLTPLSKVVQTMRQTIQTSKYMEQMGPFFIGHKIWQSD